MRGFYISKPKIIKCKDCKVEIERITPNHKRCKDCAYKISIKRAIKNSKRYDKEDKRQYAVIWYQRNKEREKKKRLEYYHRHKPLLSSTHTNK